MTLSPVETPLLDPSALETLRKVAGDSDPGFVAEMAQLFLAETRKALKELGEANARADAHTLSRIAHSLKSSSATLGLMRLSKACLALEIATKNGDLHAQDLVGSVCAQFDEAAPHLEQVT